MFCCKCQRDISLCICPDLEERLDHAVAEGRFVYKYCKKCGKHYERCKCTDPDWGVKNKGSGKGRRMKADEQLELWVKGESVHNDERNECCPDFSCCKPNLLAPEHERRAFLEASQKGNHKATTSMLYEFLGRAFSSPAVYVAGYKENPKKERG